jgi:drug/metabolite transporter (DMT)-like permease
MRQRLLHWGMIGGMVAFWGASFVFTKVAMRWLGPTMVAFCRWTVTALALLGWLAATGKLCSVGRLLRQDGRAAAWIALVGITLFYATGNLALRYTTAINASVLTNLITVFMALIGTFWLGERLALAEWLAMAGAFVGAGLVSQGAGHLTLSAPGLRGDLLLVLGALFGAIYSVGGKRLVATYPPDVTTTAFAGLGALFLLPLAIWEVHTNGGIASAMGAPATAWLMVLLLGLGSGALANLLWMYLLSTTEAARAGMSLLLIPLFSAGLAIVALGEPLTPTVLAGALLVVVGVGVVQNGARAAQRKGPEHAS